MEVDEHLSSALEKLAEDVVKECDQSFVPADDKPLLSVGRDTSDGTTKHSELVDNRHAGVEADVLANENLPNIQALSDEMLSVLVAPSSGPDVDHLDPSFAAIKQAFTRCLEEIQSLKSKLSRAVREISHLKQELVVSESSREKPNLRDIATATDSELIQSPTLKVEEETSSLDTTPVHNDRIHAKDGLCHVTFTEETPIIAEFECDSDSSSSAIVVAKRRKRKRHEVRQVTEQTFMTSGDDVTDDYIPDDGVLTTDASCDEAVKVEIDKNHGAQECHNFGAEINGEKPAKRKPSARKQTKPKKKRTKKVMHECEICKKSFSRPADLRKHCLTHSKNDRNEYECEICQETFSKFSDFASHHKTHPKLEAKPKPRESQFPCSLCEKVFPERASLKRHKKSHPRECPICQVSISCKNYSVHVRGHTGEKPYKCDQCTMAFVGPRHLARHMRVHTGEKPYTCSVCNKSFSEAGALRTHSRRHTGERPYICETCGKSFAQLTGLTYHIRTHTGEKPYKCDVCNKKFAQVTGLENHKRTHTGEKPYCCDICGRCFAVAITFTQHKRTHTGEKPYKCDVCARAFTTGGALHRHKVIHAGVKPHVCVVCGVAFARLGDLQRHVRIHTGVRPHKCDTCGKSFSRRSHLQAHGKTHGDKGKKGVVVHTASGLVHPARTVDVGMNPPQQQHVVERMQGDRMLLPERPLEQNAVNTMPRGQLNPGEGAPMYLGVANRGMEEMSYNSRAVFPDRLPLTSHERHVMTPDSTTSYQERGVMEQQGTGQGEERAGVVQERPANLQEFLPGLPHPQINMAPGAYTQWNFSFQ